MGALVSRIALAILLSLSAACVATDDLAEIREMQLQGRSDESLAPLQALIEEGDRRPEVLYRYAQALLYVGEQGRAIWALDALIGNGEFSVAAGKELALVSLTSGNHDLSLQTISKLREVTSGGELEDDIGLLMLEARAHLESRRAYGEALGIIDQILDLEPENDNALRYQVAALLGDGQSDEAYEVIQGLGLDDPGAEDAPSDSGERAGYWCSVGVSFQREAGELEQAEEIARQCLEWFPNDPAVLKRLIEIYSAQGKAEETLGVLESAYRDRLDDRGLRMQLVLQLRAMQRFDEAEAVLRNAVAREEEKEGQAGNEGLRAMLIADVGRFLIDRDRIDEGLEAYDQVNALIPSSQSPDFLLSHAEALLRVGRYEEALEIAEKTPADVHRAMIRGRVAYDREEFDEALQYLQQASRVWPDNGPIRYYLALAHEAQGRFDLAIEEYRQALRSDRALAPARVRLARLHLAENRVAHANAIMMLAPASENALSSLDSKRVSVAIQARLGQAIDLQNFPVHETLSPAEVRAVCVQALGDAYRARSDAAESVEALDKLRQNAPDLFASLFAVEVVESLVQSNQGEEAVRHARAAWAEDPNDPLRVLALGRALSSQEASLAEARKLLRRAVADLESARARLWLAEVERELGDVDQAIEQLEAATQRPEPGPAVIVALSQALVESGRQDEAAARLESHLHAIDPYDGEAALELARLIEVMGGSNAQRAELAQRALRFGAGEPALEILQELDPLRFGADAVVDES